MARKTWLAKYPSLQQFVAQSDDEVLLPTDPCERLVSAHQSPRVVGLDGADVTVEVDETTLRVTRYSLFGKPEVKRYRPLRPGEAPRHWASVHYYGHVWNEVDDKEAQ